MRRILLGLRVYAVGSLMAAPAAASETINYSYDELGRLTQSWSTGTVNNGVTQTTTYDPAGNRSSYSVTGSPNMAAIDAAGAVAFAALRTTGFGGALHEAPGWQARTFWPEIPDRRVGEELDGSPRSGAPSSPY